MARVPNVVMDGGDGGDGGGGGWVCGWEEGRVRVFIVWRPR
jgi:hypothetical protein